MARTLDQIDLDHLARCVAAGEITQRIANEAASIFNALITPCSDLPDPVVHSNDMDVLMVWRAPRVVLTAEVLPEGPVGFYFADGKCNSHIGTWDPGSEPMPEWLEASIRTFIADAERGLPVPHPDFRRSPRCSI